MLHNKDDPNCGCRECSNEDHDPTNPDCSCATCNRVMEGMAEMGTGDADNTEVEQVAAVARAPTRAATTATNATTPVRRTNPYTSVTNRVTPDKRRKTGKLHVFTPTAKPSGARARGTSGPDSVLDIKGYSNSLTQDDWELLNSLVETSGIYDLKRVKDPYQTEPTQEVQLLSA